MAEEQVASQVLVLDGSREKLAKRINNVELRLKDERLEKQKTMFCKMFMALCERYFKLRSLDLLNITDDNEEFLTLESEVLKKAERDHKLIKYLMIPVMSLIPIFGWAYIIEINGMNNVSSIDSYNDFLSYRYYRLHRKLMEKEGKEFFPFETLKQMLQPKS